jgi:hypothetical protein
MALMIHKKQHFATNKPYNKINPKIKISRIESVRNFKPLHYIIRRENFLGYCSTILLQSQLQLFNQNNYLVNLNLGRKIKTQIKILF